MRKPWTKLSDEQWGEISKRIAAGELQADLAKEFNVTQSAVSRVLSGSNRARLAVSHAPCAKCGVPFRITSHRRKYCDSALCANARRHDRYLANVEKHKAQVEAARRRAMLRVDRLKDVPCADCGTYYPGEPYLMDFDHRDPSTKNPKLRFRNGSRRSSLKSLSMAEREAEIAKCDVVCKICHARRTKRKGHHSLSAAIRTRRGTTRNGRAGSAMANAEQVLMFVA